MTKETFLQRHGEAWNAFKRDPMFIDLISTLESLSPHKLSCRIGMQNSTDNSKYIVGTIAGYSSCLDIMESQLSFEEKVIPPEVTYEETSL